MGVTSHRGAGRGAVRDELRRAVGKIAAGSAVPVFPMAGVGGRDAARRIRLSRRLEVVSSPRAANVLLIAGEITPRLLRPAIRIHDQASPPRATLFLIAGGAPEPDVPSKPEAGSNTEVAAVESALRTHAIRDRFFPFAGLVHQESEVEAASRALHRDLVLAERATEPAIQPDRPPLPWRGRGPYGHGGKGMTGGAPYGRPLPERGNDRDGLQLDRLPLRIGPFFPPLVPGLLLDVELHGDVVQAAELGPNPFSGYVGASATCPFMRALASPVRIADLELSRARSHLRWLSDALHALDLSALSIRALALAERLEADNVPLISAELARFSRRLERSRTLTWATRGVGHIRVDQVGDTHGPVARATGVEADARCDDIEYLALGFRPIVHDDGDAWARWRQRIGEARQSLRLVTQAGDRRSGGAGIVEDPRGMIRLQTHTLDSTSQLLPELVTGREWGDAVLAAVSLDLDLERDARLTSVIEEGR